MNLLQNASVHTPPGTPVSMRVVRDRRAWRFEVEDRGPGLSIDADRAFEQFTTGPGSRGTGLGLAVVRTIATAHGGEAGVEDRQGEGARFWIRIPR